MPIRVRLEFDEIRIHRERKRWNLYFIVVADHPIDQDRRIISIIPNDTMKLSPAQENSYVFDSGPGSEGLFIFSQEMPISRAINAHVYLRHSRQTARSFGAVLAELSDLLKTDAGVDHIIEKNLSGVANVPWISIAKTAIEKLGQILAKIPDRDMGFLSVFERFGNEFEIQTDIDRYKEFTTGEASLVYSWSVEQEVEIPA
ncbi:hypothetical protein [Haliscomenobacter sp.]|uniref:hypothetical protein n=1 Tax=Haliscomenobacter sp. TaxID=2717303 RepID=UPI003593C790